MVTNRQSIGDVDRMFDLREFENRLYINRHLVTKPYTDSFDDFWKWKCKHETKTEHEHILDDNHRADTYNMLCDMAGKWQVYRPQKSGWREGLKISLEKIAKAYDQIRGHSLLEIDKIPQEPLKSIWHELGRIKSDNSDGCYYYTVAITKPLMFLWGQTLAFDSNVKKTMSDIKIPKGKIKATTWNFETWTTSLKRFSNILKQDPEVVKFIGEKSAELYGPGCVIPYGRFLDIYYWIGGLPYEQIYKIMTEKQSRPTPA